MWMEEEKKLRKGVAMTKGDGKTFMNWARVKREEREGLFGVPKSGITAVLR